MLECSFQSVEIKDMGLVELLLSIGFAVSVGIGFAMTPAAINSQEFWIARSGFIIAAIAVGSAYFYWVWEEERPSILRVTFGVIAGVLSVVGVVEAIYWVNSREVTFNLEKAEAGLNKTTQAAASQTSATKETVEMPTLDKLMSDEFPNFAKGFLEYTLTLPSNKKIKVKAVLYMDTNSGADFLGFYVPSSVKQGQFLTYETCEFLLKQQKDFLHDLRSKYGIETKRLGEANNLSSDNMIFSGMIYIYHEDDLSAQQLSKLIDEFKAKHLTVQFRGRAYVAAQWAGRSKW
jgi:hypothetical protein